MTVSAQTAIDLTSKLGILTAGFEFEAEEIWNNLNKLSTEQPIEYQRLLASILQDKQSPPINETIVRPNAGFSIRGFLKSTDCFKIYENGIQNQCFLNICWHESVYPPQTTKGQATDEDFLNSVDIEVPMLFGNQRVCEDSADSKSIAIDVIVHKRVIDLCNNPILKLTSPLVRLAIENLALEKGLVLDPIQWDQCSRNYSHGLGPDKLTPVLLFLRKDGINHTKQDIRRNGSRGHIVLQTLIDPPQDQSLELRRTPPPTTREIMICSSSKLVPTETSKQLKPPISQKIIELQEPIPIKPDHLFRFSECRYHWNFEVFR
jgi:hypothetical protein